MIRSSRKRIAGFALAGSALLLVGCTRDGRFQAISMWNESKVRPFAESPVFANGSASQPLIPGTVARGELRVDDAMYTGRSGGKLVNSFPFPVTDAVVARGQERFNVYCSPCHGRLGDGQGMIVQRGFPQPPDYALLRLRQAPVGHFYDVITHGYGAMFSYASRVAPNDRWAVASYIRLLQSRRPIVLVDTRNVVHPETRAAGPQAGGTYYGR